MASGGLRDGCIIGIIAIEDGPDVKLLSALALVMQGGDGAARVIGADVIDTFAIVVVTDAFREDGELELLCMAFRRRAVPFRREPELDVPLCFAAEALALRGRRPR